jgi:IS30 family transposase
VGKKWQKISPESRREIYRLAAQGKTQREIGEAVGYTARSVCNVLMRVGGVIRKEMWEPPSHRLSLEDRVEILLGLERQQTFRHIARRLGRNVSTVSREVNANGGRTRYQPMAAHRRAHRRTLRPKPTKLASNPELRARVTGDLLRLWSPQQIATRLSDEFGDDDSMRISHETIYKSIYVQGRGELRRELARCLRTGRAKRIPKGRLHKSGPIADMIMISERPAEVEDRAIPGHWEGDLLMGKDNKSAIGTLVERSTRFVMLFPLRGGKTAPQVREAMTETVQKLPDAVKRTLTWDRGSEMSQHVRFRIDTGIDVYFCDPHSPWQRGSNENTNGLLRQFFPKGRGLSRVTDAELQRAADLLNGRPRETLGWKTPAEKLAEFVASTD